MAFVKKIKKSVFLQIAIPASMTLLLIVLIVGTTLMAFKMLESDGNLINVSGSERMRIMLLGFSTHRYYMALVSGDGDEASKLKKEVEREVEIYQKFLTGLENGSDELSLPKYDEKGFTALFARIKILWVPYRESILKITNNDIPFEDKNKELANITYWKTIQLKNTNHELVQLYNEKSNRKITLAQIVELVFLFLSFFIMALSMLYVKKIITPLNNVTYSLNDIADGEGDLTVQLDVNTDDEIGMVAENFNKFVLKIRDVINAVQDIATQLASSSEEMSASSVIFSEHAQNQAASAEEITATIEEMSAGMDNIATGANKQYGGLEELINKMRELSDSIEEMEYVVKESRNQTDRINNDAMAGEVFLNKMISSMKKIDDSSGEMKNIVDMINDISDQINLLSLNAAIESARAGDAGRGFAVVADQISKLADQTAASISDIDHLIKENSEEITQGMKNVEESIDMMKTIMDGVKVINEMMNKITIFMDNQTKMNKEVNTEAGNVKLLSNSIKTSTDEQKIAASEIVNSISNITELTQVNASGAEEVAATSEEIAGMADTLQQKIGLFKV